MVGEAARAAAGGQRGADGALHQAGDGHGLPREDRRQSLYAAGNFRDDSAEAAPRRGGCSSASRSSQAVITVPAYFTDSQRQATRDAGRIAGLDVLRIINEPTAAAFAYGLDHGQAQKILVYDLGGGTFDVSLIEIGDGVIEVLATSGDNHLGGDDFDERLADYLADEFKRTEKIDLKRDKAAMLRVREAAEKAKRELSGQMSTQVTLPFLTQDANGPHHLDVTVTRAQFEGMTRDLVERTCGPVSQVMTDAALSMSDLGQVLLVGGSTRMPAVQEMVKKLTGKAPARNVNPDECVAMGAALQGGKLARGQRHGGRLRRAERHFDGRRAAVAVHRDGRRRRNQDYRPATRPSRPATARFSPPPRRSRPPWTSRFCRASGITRGTTSCWAISASKGIRRAMAGVPQIEVTFAIDANGIVTVSAKDLGTGNQQEITISSTTNMSEEEIRRAMEDARRYEAQDKARQRGVRHSQRGRKAHLRNRAGARQG